MMEACELDRSDYIKDTKSKVFKEQLKIAETGLLPPGTEFDIILDSKIFSKYVKTISSKNLNLINKLDKERRSYSQDSPTRNHSEDTFYSVKHSHLYNRNYRIDGKIDSNEYNSNTEKVKGDIENNKVPYIEDSKSTIFKEQLKIVETKVMSPGTEFDVGTDHIKSGLNINDVRTDKVQYLENKYSDDKRKNREKYFQQYKSSQRCKSYGQHCSFRKYSRSISSSERSRSYSSKYRSKHSSSTDNEYKSNSQIYDKNCRRDPIKMKRDIEKDKIKYIKDQEDRFLKEQLTIAPTGLLPFGTEFDAISNSNIFSEYEPNLSNNDTQIKKSNEKHLRYNINNRSFLDTQPNKYFHSRSRQRYKSYSRESTDRKYKSRSRFDSDKSYSLKHERKSSSFCETNKLDAKINHRSYSRSRTKYRSHSRNSSNRKYRRSRSYFSRDRSYSLNHRRKKSYSNDRDYRVRKRSSNLDSHFYYRSKSPKKACRQICSSPTKYNKNQTRKYYSRSCSTVSSYSLSNYKRNHSPRPRHSKKISFMEEIEIKLRHMPPTTSVNQTASRIQTSTILPTSTPNTASQRFSIGCPQLNLHNLTYQTLASSPKLLVDPTVIYSNSNIPNYQLGVQNSFNYSYPLPTHLQQSERSYSVSHIL